MARADYLALIDAMTRDDSGAVSAAQRDDALTLALLRYAADRPPAAGAAAPELTGAKDTVPPADREAVCALAAATLLDQLAARHAGDADSTLGADAVGRQGLADRYSRLAAVHRARYRASLGLRAAPRAAGATAPPWGAR